MNAVFSPRLVQALLLAALGIACWSLGASVASAADSTPLLQANIIYDLVADRTRMIQVSMVFVAFGCAIIWWYR
jgi:hypothetical protein